MISTTRYKGKVSILFPITYSKVIILPERHFIDFAFVAKKWLQRMNPTSLNEAASSTSTYKPVQVVWPYAHSSTGPPVVQSEQDWWTIWKDPIQNGILSRKVGWVTVADWKEAVMGSVVPEPKKSWEERDDCNTL